MSPQQIAAMALAARRAAGTIQRYYRGYKARKTYRTKKKPTQKKAGTNAGLPKYKIGSSSGMYGKKGKKPKRILGVQWKESDFWEPDQTEVCYWGAGYGTSRTSYITLLMMHYVQDIAKRRGITIDNWNGLIQTPHGSTGTGSDGQILDWMRVELSYVRNEDNNYSYQSNSVGVSSTTTFKQLAESLRTSVITYARDGYYLTTLKGVDLDDRYFYYRNRVDEDMVTYTTTFYCKMQNVTPSDDSTTGASTINDVNANPIRGKIYDFSDNRPKLAPAFAHTLKSEAGFESMPAICQDETGERQVNVFALRNGGVISGQLHNAFRLPPNGAAVFKNCTGVKDVSIPAGGFYTVKRTRKHSGKLRRVLIEMVHMTDHSPDAGRYYITGKPTSNLQSFMIGLRPTIKSQENESVKLVINKDTNINVSIKRTKVPNAPAYVNVT